jgi:hypothetical protein
MTCEHCPIKTPECRGNQIPAFCDRMNPSSPLYAPQFERVLIKDDHVFAKLQYPSLATQTGNAVAAAGRAVTAFARGEHVFVSPEEEARRGAICESNECGKFDATQRRCTLCGCKTDIKRRLKTESCPDTPSRW